MAEQEIITRALKSAGIEQLNAMQKEALSAPVHRDLMLISPTGSGKTFAFLLPLLPLLSPERKGIDALVITPSRELALQIETVFRSLATGLSVRCCYGGHPFATERRSLQDPPSLLIGTPGRILDHLTKGTIDLSQVRFLILDEFDKSLELGFLKEMRAIITSLSCLRRRILTSATNAVDIPPFVGMKDPIRLDYSNDKDQKGGKLTVRVVQSPQKDKLDTLVRLLGELGDNSAIVFCNHRESAERVSDYLHSLKIPNECFHGGMEQSDREESLIRFSNGSSLILVSTDLASRGLDISEVKNIIHYHLPVNEEAYLHRNGRTARQSASGNVFLILNELDRLPEYITPYPEEFFLPANARVPLPPKWATVTISKGKRDKLSKSDVVGFLLQKGQLKKEDLGNVTVTESCAFAAVNADEKQALLRRIEGEKIKNRNVTFS